MASIQQLETARLFRRRGAKIVLRKAEVKTHHDNHPPSLNHTVWKHLFRNFPVAIFGTRPPFRSRMLKLPDCFPTPIAPPPKIADVLYSRRRPRLPVSTITF